MHITSCEGRAAAFFHPSVKFFSSIHSRVQRMNSRVARVQVSMEWVAMLMFLRRGGSSSRQRMGKGISLRRIWGKMHMPRPWLTMAMAA